MRLDKFIADNSLFTRSEIKRLAKQKRIMVDGSVITNTAVQVSGEETISIEGENILEQTHLYLKIHKPQGVVCATSDFENPTVIDELFQQAELENDTQTLLAIEKGNLQIVGRLDKDTTGLVLLTTDGEWNHRITSPKNHCNKTYRVQLVQPISAQDIAALTRGITLKGEPKPTKPAKIEQHCDTEISLTISEGKYHQIKRMLAAVGNKVVELHRLKIGEIDLHDIPTQSQYQHLTPQEINQFIYD